MIKIQKVHMTGCVPCQEVDKYLEDLQAEGLEFEVESFDIKSPVFKERRAGKGLLGQYATLNVPFLLFLKDDKPSLCIYKEETEKTEDYKTLIKDRYKRLIEDASDNDNDNDQ